MASEGLSNSAVAVGGQLTGSAGTATLLHASKHTTQSASAPETEQATPSREIWFQKHLKIKVLVKLCPLILVVLQRYSYIHLIFQMNTLLYYYPDDSLAN